MNTRAQRLGLWLPLLAVAGLVYAVLATRWYVEDWAVLVPAMNSIAGTLLFRIFWFGVAMWPITIVATALRFDPTRWVAVVVLYQLVMTFSVFAFTPWNVGEAMGLILGFGPNFLLQLLIWLPTMLIVRSTQRT